MPTRFQHKLNHPRWLVHLAFLVGEAWAIWFVLRPRLFLVGDCEPPWYQTQEAAKSLMLAIAVAYVVALIFIDPFRVWLGRRTLPQFRIRTLMVVVAVVALVLYAWRNFLSW